MRKGGVITLTKHPQAVVNPAAPNSGAGAPGIVSITREEFYAAVKAALDDYSRYGTMVRIIGGEAELITSDAWRRVLSHKDEARQSSS